MKMLRIAGLSDVIVMFDMNPEHLGMMGISAPVQAAGDRAVPVAKEPGGGQEAYLAAAQMAA